MKKSDRRKGKEKTVVIIAKCELWVVGIEAPQPRVGTLWGYTDKKHFEKQLMRLCWP